MVSQPSDLARAAAGKAREVVAKVRPGPTEGHRSLPVRADAAEIRKKWDDPEQRRAVLDGIPVRDASITVGAKDRDWGVRVTLELELSELVPGMAAQALAGKALRRLKAACETGEIPTTDFNPSARPDAGEPAS